METQHQENTTQQANKKQSPPPSSASSPSPSHEFTFSISLDPTATKIPDNNNSHKLKSSLRQTSSSAIDLSPADDIFFHGHLLPLRHITSEARPLVSPRSSTNSLDSVALPVKDQGRHQASSFQEDRRSCLLLQEREGIKEKSKSFSLFGNRKRVPSQDKERKKSKFEILKRYFRLFNPFDSLRNARQRNQNKNNDNASGSLLQIRNRQESRGKHRRRELFSAPASTKASPTNSGRLNLAASSGTISPINAKNDSTMEELQAAIQAAIAHCKKSIAAASTEDAIVSCE